MIDTCNDLGPVEFVSKHVVNSGEHHSLCILSTPLEILYLDFDSATSSQPDNQSLFLKLFLTLLSGSTIPAWCISFIWEINQYNHSGPHPNEIVAEEALLTQRELEYRGWVYMITSRSVEKQCL